MDPAPEGSRRNRKKRPSVCAVDPFLFVTGPAIFFPASSFGQARLAAAQSGFARAHGLSPGIVPRSANFREWDMYVLLLLLSTASVYSQFADPGRAARFLLSGRCAF